MSATCGDAPKNASATKAAIRTRAASFKMTSLHYGLNWRKALFAYSRAPCASPLRERTSLSSV